MSASETNARVAASRALRVRQLMNTSVDDCRSSIDHIHDVEFLERLWGACQARGHKTRAIIVRRRINKLLDAKRGRA